MLRESEPRMWGILATCSVRWPVRGVCRRPAHTRDSDRDGCSDPDGKRQYVVEVVNTVDVGTSLLLDAQAEEDFTAQTSLLAVAQPLRAQGLPDHVTVDRDRALSSVGAV